MSKREIAAIAKKVLAREIEPIEGCRSMVKLQQSLDAASRSDPDFLTIVAIESETDHFVLGAERKNWESQALNDLDRKRQEYLQRNQGYLHDACKAIIDKFD